MASAATLLLVSSIATGVAGVAQFKVGLDAAKAEEIASRERAAELKLRAQQERTQKALGDVDRERLARRTLASQRAAFASGGVEFSTGTALRIQEETAGIINREERLSGLQSNLTVSNLNRQARSELQAGRFRAGARRFGAGISLIQTGAKVASFESERRRL